MKVNEERTISIDEFFKLSEEGGTYEIETPQGWVEMGDLVKKINKECFTIRTASGRELSGSNDHYVETTYGWEKLEDIDLQDCFVRINTCEQSWDRVVSKDSIGVHDTYDLEVLNDEHKYYANDIVSHNTGKTTIGHIVCNNVPDNTVIWITPEVIQENQQRSYSSIKLLYKLADFVAPSIIILEDIDLFGGDRNRGGDMMGLGSLMNVLDGVNTVKNAVTIASTNSFDTIEKALSQRPGRFDRIVEIPALDGDLRSKMFADRLKEWKYSENMLDHLVQRTDKWTGAEAQEFVNTLNLKSIRSDEKIEELDIELVDEILEVMNKFGVGKNSSEVFGFTKRDK